MKKILIFTFLICIILSISIMLYFYIQKPLNVEIITPNEKTKYSIFIDKEIIVEGYTGNLLIQISNKKVRVKDSNCSNQICVKTGWISKVGEMIICAPNRVSVIILSD